jgi:hypothetical protein
MLANWNTVIILGVIGSVIVTSRSKAADVCAVIASARDCGYCAIIAVVV